MKIGSSVEFRRGALAGGFLVAVLAAALALLGPKQSAAPLPGLKDLLHISGARAEVPSEQLSSEEIKAGRLEYWRIGEFPHESHVYLLVPRETIGASVIVLHGHGSDAREALGLGPAKNMGPIARELALQGFVALVPEIRFASGDLRQETRSALRLIASGRTLMGERVQDVLGYAEFLRSREGIRRDAIGILGWSMGGILGLYAGALDPGVKAVYASGAFGSYASLFSGDLASPDNYVPGIMPFGGLTAVARLIAPRPLFIEAKEDDVNWRVSDVLRQADALKSRYALAGCPACLRVEVYPGGHSLDGREAIPWLKLNLARGSRL